MKGTIRPFLKQPGYTKVDCGSLKLQWNYKGFVAFFEGYKSEDEGVELAPTPWSDIKDVNIRDPRITWFKYDKTRKRIDIPIEKLWPDKEKKE
jgi:hypothetical protein